MIDFKKLSNETLHENTIGAASIEKKATLFLLEHLAEIDRRRVYAIRGYPSLWDYVHKALGYSEAQAWDRVSAMRLIVRVPEVRTELAEGRLTLTTTAKLGAHIRREKLNLIETQSLLQEVAGKSSREVERVLVAKSSEPQKPDRVQPVAKNVTRISIDVSDEFLALMKRVKELNRNPAAAPQEIFEMTMREYVKKREPKVRTKSRHENESTNSKNISAASSVIDAPSLRAPEVKNTGSGQPATKDSREKISRYVAKATRDLIRNRSGDRCEFFDHVTRRRCECRVGLEFDHVRPFALDGGNEVSNLRHYCAAHNRLAAIQAFGERKMGEYLKL